MKAIAAAAFVGIAMASTPSLAADLFANTAPPMSFPAESGPTAEVGSNWYLRGDVGVGLDDAPVLDLSGISTPPQGDASTTWSPKIGSSQFSTDFTADVGVGYRFNNYFRGELAYIYRGGPGGSNQSQVVCPYGDYVVQAQNPNADGVYIQYGYLYNPTNTCDGYLKLRQFNNAALASGYLDIGTWWGVTPYVGAGVGLNVNTMSGSLTYVQTSNGAPYNANLTPTGTAPQIWVNSSGAPISPQPAIAFAPQNWDRSIAVTKYSMAWALMAGVGIQLSPSATLDIGYRYFNAGVENMVVNAATGTVVKEANTSQQLLVGIRYMAD